VRISSTNLNSQILHVLMHAQASTGCNQVNNVEHLSWAKTMAMLTQLHPYQQLNLLRKCSINI